MKFGLLLLSLSFSFLFISCSKHETNTEPTIPNAKVSTSQGVFMMLKGKVVLSDGTIFESQDGFKIFNLPEKYCGALRKFSSTVSNSALPETGGAFSYEYVLYNADYPTCLQVQGGSIVSFVSQNSSHGWPVEIWNLNPRMQAKVTTLACASPSGFYPSIQFLNMFPWLSGNPSWPIISAYQNDLRDNKLNPSDPFLIQSGWLYSGWGSFFKSIVTIDLSLLNPQQYAQIQRVSYVFQADNWQGGTAPN